VVKSGNSLKEYNKFLLITFILLFFVSFFVAFKYNSIKSFESNKRREILKSVLWQLKNHNISYTATDDLYRIDIIINSEKQLKIFLEFIQNIANSTSCELKEYSIREESDRLNLRILLAHNGKIISTINILKKHKQFSPKISIIIDDAGYGNELTDEFIKFPAKITISVLPALQRSRSIAKKIFDAGKEVILHMPMEPEKYVKRLIPLMKYEIMTDMAEQEIYDIMEKMLSTVPYAVGVNNHQGSRATSDTRTMKFVLQKIKEKGLFFIDSLTSPKSVTKEIAEFLNVPYAVRDIFLDNKDDYDYVKSQMNKLIEIALKQGQAVGIGHINRKNTLKVLYDILPELKEKNIRLVFASEIVKKFHYKEVN